MDGLLVLLGATGLLTLLGHLAAVFGADSREDFGDDRQARARS